jgi:hypothetical protein
MKQNTILFLLLIILTLLSGCSTFKVYEESNSKPLKGIPFFSQKEIITQTTLRTRSWIDLSILIKVFVDGEEISKLNRSLNYKIKPENYNPLRLKSEFLDLETALNNNSNNIEDLNSRIKNYLINQDQLISDVSYIDESSIDYKNTLTHLFESIISNYYKTKMIVDYSKKYYLNTKIYPFTNTNSNITIAANGTLTNATNNVDSTNLAEVIPLNDFLTEKLKLGEAEPISMDEEENNKIVLALKSTSKNTTKARKTIEFKLSISTKESGFLYTITQEYNGQECNPETGKCTDPIVRNPCTEKACNPLKITDSGISVVRSKIGTKTQKKDDKSYKINGSITPPKNK